MKISGTYYIKNKLTNKFYIGSSIDIVERFSHHKRTLRSNTHHNKFLQHSWNKYKEENFEFIILDTCLSACECIEKEQILLNENFGKKHCYNLSSSSIHPINVTLSEETKKKISLAKLGHNHSLSTKIKMKNRESSKLNIKIAIEHNKNRKYSDLHKKNISLGKKKKEKNLNTRRKEEN